MKKKLFRNAMANAMAALLCAMVWLGPASAAEPVPDYMLYYSGEQEFCLHLLRNADKAEKIEPVIGLTHVMDIHEGERYASKTRFYIVKSPMSRPDIYQLIKQRKWNALLGYMPWKANSSAGRMVTDPRWRKYDDQCPGIFQIRDYNDPEKIIDTPTQMSLYHFDADGDGKRDTIYRHQFDYTGHYFAVADFKTCSLNPIIGQRATANLFQFEGKSFVISDIHLGSVSVYRINNLASKIDANYPTCYFSEINQFTDYRANKLLINQLKYRR